MDFGKIIAWTILAVIGLAALTLAGSLLQLGLNVLGLFISLITSLAGMVLSLVFSKAGLILMVIALVVYIAGQRNREPRHAHWY